MKIKMKTTSCSPLGIKLKDKVYEVGAEEGKQLVDGNFAELIEADPAPEVEVKEKPSKKGKVQEEEAPKEPELPVEETKSDSEEN